VEVEIVIMVVERLDNRLVVLWTMYGMVLAMDDLLSLVEAAEAAKAADMQSVA
jgi:hypothetical protein